MTADDRVALTSAVAQAGIHPPEEMPFGIAWSTVPSPAWERGLLQHGARNRGQRSRSGASRCLELFGV